MLKIFGLVLATITLVVGRNVDVSGRVIGGYHVNIKSHPYIVSIHNVEGNFLCAGSLISLKWVATVAHSVTNHPAEEMYILSNSTSASEGIKTDILTVEIYPDYDPNNLNHDIALLELTEAVSCLYCTPTKINKNGPTIGEMVSVLGWGRSSADSTELSALSLVEIPVTNHEMCADTYSAAGKTILNDTFCVGTISGQVLGTCRGDEGGPVFTSEGLAGIVSLGDRCIDESYPGVYTKYEYYFNWIKEVAGVVPV